MTPMTPETSRRRRSSRSRDPERSRTAILLAARHQFEEHGFAGARTNEIARAADVPQGLLYHYFENKEALFRAVMDDAMAPYFQATIELLENPPEGRAGARLLETAIRMYFEFLRDNPHVPQLMAWWTADARWGAQGPMDDEELCHRPMVLGAQRISEAQQAGVIRRELDPEMVIRLFLNLCMHWHQTWGEAAADHRIDPKSEDAVDDLHQRHLDHIVDVILRGVLTPRAQLEYGLGGADLHRDA